MDDEAIANELGIDIKDINLVPDYTIATASASATETNTCSEGGEGSGSGSGERISTDHHQNNNCDVPDFDTSAAPGSGSLLLRGQTYL
jgi:hypothetical protein